MIVVEVLNILSRERFLIEKGNKKET